MIKIGNINIIKNNTFKTFFKKSLKIRPELNTKIVKKAQIILPSPLVLYNLKAARDSANAVNKDNAIKQLDKLLKNGKITEKEHAERVKKIQTYYDNADDLPVEVSSNKIKSNAPNFKGYNEEQFERLSEIDTPDFDIDNLDVSVSEELREFIDVPIDEIPEGLMGSISEFIPDGIDSSGDVVFTSLKNIFEEATSWL